MNLVSFWPKVIIFGLLVVIIIVKTHNRDQVWKDEVTFWTDMVAKFPGKDKDHSNLGAALVFMGASGPAIEAFNLAYLVAYHQRSN